MIYIFYKTTESILIASQRQYGISRLANDKRGNVVSFHFICSVSNSIFRTNKGLLNRWAFRGFILCLSICLRYTLHKAYCFVNWNFFGTHLSWNFWLEANTRFNFRYFVPFSFSFVFCLFWVSIWKKTQYTQWWKCLLRISVQVYWTRCLAIMGLQD